MRVAIPVLPNGMMNAHLGRTKLMAIAEIVNNQIEKWDVIELGFQVSHNEHPQNDHHHHDHDDHHHHHHKHDHDDHHHHHEHDHHHDHDHSAMREFLEKQNIDFLIIEHLGRGFQLEFQNIKFKIITGAVGKAREVVESAIEQGLIS